MLGPDEADDATQEAFIRAWEKLHTFRGEAGFGTWMYRLAVNVLLARGASRRGGARWPRRDEALADVPARREEREAVMDLEAAMERLPPGAREVFVLHDVEGFKHDEIARMLGVTDGTSKAQLHRARMILRRHLER